jgi:uncharacterized membrane protein
MIKRNKGLLILTSAIMLLPIIVGLLLWDKLPEKVPVHWNVAGEVDGWGSKTMVVFGLPLFILATHWVCTFATALDPKNQEINTKVVHLVLWICPCLSLVCNTFVYAATLGYDLSIQIIMPLLFGLLFMVIGNLAPKCKRNYTIGMKLPWTLNDEENWNKTHRFGGKVWLIGGAVIVATAVLGNFIIFFGIIILMIILPTIYSYVYYRKHPKTVE